MSLEYRAGFGAQSQCYQLFKGQYTLLFFSLFFKQKKMNPVFYCVDASGKIFKT